MTLQTYSRDYLKSMPEQRKQQMIDSIVKGFIHEIQTAASVGLTSYRYVRPTLNGVVLSSSPDPVLTDADIIAGFFARFPGCKIYYEEVLADSLGDKKVLKKGIVIDWS